MQPIASLRSWGWPSNSCFLLAKPVRPRKLSGEFVESGTFWTYLCCLVLMFHPVQKSWCLTLKSGAGSILHQWRGGDPRDMRQAWAVTRPKWAWNGLESLGDRFDMASFSSLSWLSLGFCQCIFKYLKARICKFWGGVLPLVNNARTFSPA
jgi:hypothetical protein